MGFYHIKNIKIDELNNKISGDLADSNWHPLDYFHINDLCDKETFEEKYANFIYNIVCWNYHPAPNNKYFKLAMNDLLEDYYNDAHDIGEVDTYKKYKTVIEGILNNDHQKVIKLKSERELYPELYYQLNPVEINSKFEYDYYKNKKGELYCYIQGKGLQICLTNKKNYAYPIGQPIDKDKFYEYNDFLKSIDEAGELEM